MSVLSMKGVCKEYQFVRALCNIDLEVREGEFLIIMGPSGSGKSTLLHMVGLLDVPTRGEVFLNSRPVPKDEDQRAHLRLKFMGYVFQDFGLMSSLKVLGNIMLPSAIAGKPRQKRAVEIAESLGISHRLDHYITEISGGEKQRVAIARALINDPRLVLADEPTGNLDSKTGEKVIEILQGLTDEGKTVVAVTHDPAHLRFADRVVFLKDGAVENIKVLNKA